MVQRSLLLFAVCLLLVCVPSRLKADDWHIVSPDDLTLKDNPKQPGADAMVLYRQVDVDAKNASVMNYLQIKIFTDAGVKDQADVELRYDKSRESIQGVQARTIQPDGTITEFNGQTFDKEIVKGHGIKYLAKTFTMPNVHPGSVIEYRYREQSDDSYYWNLEWVVQHGLYTREARFSIKPDPSDYAPELLYRLYNLPDAIKPQKQGNGIYTLTIQDVPGIVAEDYMPPASVLESRVAFYYRNPDEPDRETTAQYWNRVGKKWNAQVEKFIDKKKELSEEVSHIVANGDSPEQKLQKIYARTLQIRNLSFEDEKSAKEAKQENIKDNNNVVDVLKHGYGGGVDINWLLMGLARAAGFDAADVRVAPRNSTIFDPNHQASVELSAELVWVHAGSKDYYLDAAAHYYGFNQLPWYETEAGGIKLTKDGAQIINTPDPAAADNTIVRHADVQLDRNMGMTGTLKVDFTGQEASSIRMDNRQEDEAGRKTNLADEIKAWLPLGATFQVTSIANWDDVEKPLHVEGTFAVPATSSIAYQRLLLPLEIFQTTEYGGFQSQRRVNNIYFSYPYEKTDDLVFQTPLGFSVQSLPPAQDVNRGAVVYSISASKQPSGVEVKRHMAVNGILFGKDAYPAIRAFFSTAKTDDDAQVLLQNGLAARND
ncbi:MAG TPA: DUF3857 domain-containing protein [Candidatus Acidoferrales bacterium]|nr:DUF3857 domain-containing protein [Candidatus Acidoferrales bacterium]